MLLAWTGALLLVPEVGPATFFATYLSSGMCGYLATLWTRILVRGELVYMFGASSAGFGVICAYFWLYRFDGFKILGLPPDPYEGIQGLGIIGLVMAFFALVPMVRRQGGGVDWMSHLVGMLTGSGCAALAEGPWRTGKEKEKEEKEYKAK
jgi:rhomboid-like protein